MKLTTRVMRVVLAGATAVALTGIGSTAYAKVGPYVASSGVTEDDPLTAPLDEGAAIDCDNITGVAKSLQTDAGAGYGYNVSSLSVAGLAWLSGSACTEAQPQVTVGANPLGSITKIAGKLVTPFSDCTSDTVEAIVNGFGAGKTIGGDEYPASGKMTITFSGINSLDPLLKPFSMQVYARSTVGTSMLGDTLALTGIVIKGPGLGGVYSTELGFLPTKVTDLVAKGGNGDGTTDMAFQAAYTAWALGGFATTVPAAVTAGMKVDTDLAPGRDVLYDANSNGFAGDSTLGATEGFTGPGSTPANLVTDSCIRYTNISGTPGTSLPGPEGGGNPTIGGGLNVPTGQGDALQAVSWFTDGTLASGGTLNSSMSVSFQP